MSGKAEKRAILTDSSIIDARTLANSHRRLAEILKPGMTVLDIGCGTGAITSDIAKKVGPTGKVIGVDNNQALIDSAHNKYSHIPNLTFEVADIYNLNYENEFDIVTAARVLQWLSRPNIALKHMAKAIKDNGKVIVLDYNHERIRWTPQIPDSMAQFFDSFMSWRTQAGMYNRIADHLDQLFISAGLTKIKITDQSEITTRSDEDFSTHINVWSGVVSFKGAQMVEEGFITDFEREIAERDFNQWIIDSAESQEMYLLAVEGTK